VTMATALTSLATNRRVRHQPCHDRRDHS
jgi:hypothetical protein